MPTCMRNKINNYTILYQSWVTRTGSRALQNCRMLCILFICISSLSFSLVPSGSYFCLNYRDLRTRRLST